ncbi:hypothetical protein [Pelagibius sp. Alg239-R121]|uniref:hypothetical protein n=1 Tax=Pelagibius sp. Alg239-R121 TaxID=2993448 RepID=UPI0024A6F6B6|nr:hypothetical protein [Pelagibius sp. Alg239-R121]
MPGSRGSRSQLWPYGQRTLSGYREPELQALRAPSSPLPAIGHNNGPPLTISNGWAKICWKKAQQEAWKTPPIEVVRSRMKRAKELGMSYREYTLEILERGRYL